MTLPASGQISMSQVNVELGRASNATTSLGESAVRTLANVPAGAVGFTALHGKSSFAVSGVSNDQVYPSAGGGNADSFPSVNVVGGVAPYTYAWSFTSNPNATTLLNATSQTATVRKHFNNNDIGDYVATLQCVVTDNTGAQRTASNVQATAEWS